MTLQSASDFHFPASIMSEVQLQRKELERLLQTAKDKDRQELLKNAIASLNEVSAGGDSLSSIHPAMRSSLQDDLVGHIKYAVDFLPSNVLTVVFAFATSNHRVRYQILPWRSLPPAAHPS